MSSVYYVTMPFINYYVIMLLYLFMSSVYYVTMSFIYYYVIMLLCLFMSSVYYVTMSFIYYYVTMSFIDELLCYSVSLLLCPHREGDAVTAAVDIEHLHLHMLV